MVSIIHVCYWPHISTPSGKGNRSKGLAAPLECGDAQNQRPFATNRRTHQSGAISTFDPQKRTRTLPLVRACCISRLSRSFRPRQRACSPSLGGPGMRQRHVDPRPVSTAAATARRTTRETSTVGSRRGPVGADNSVRRFSAAVQIENKQSGYGFPHVSV
jgi:hypothetical protein